MLSFPNTEAGEKIGFSIPLVERDVKELIRGISKEYDIHWVGGTIESIEPAGKYVSVYE